MVCSLSNVKRDASFLEELGNTIGDFAKAEVSCSGVYWGGR